jgi:hypothetical protein
MNPPTLFPTDNLVQPKAESPKKKYKQSKLAKKRYNLAHRVGKAGVKSDAKTRTFDAVTLKHADPLTRKRVTDLMKLGFGGELNINFPE